MASNLSTEEKGESKEGMVVLDQGAGIAQVG